MYVIKLESNRFKTTAVEPEFAQYIGISDMDGISFPTNAFPFLFANKEAAEKYLSSNTLCIFMSGAVVEEYNAVR